MSAAVSGENRAVFETMPVPQAVRSMALPTIASQIIVLIYNMADTFWIGRVNNPYMVAAASLVLPVFNISLALSGLPGVGGGSQISRLLGAGEEEEASRVSAYVFRVAVIITAFFSLITLTFMHPLLTLLGASGNTYGYAKEYALCVIVLGGLPTVLSNVMANLLRSTGYAKKAGFGITMGGILNMALDPLFMFVLIPRGHEVMAAGLATFVSNIVVCVYFVRQIRGFRGATVIRFFRGGGKPSPASVKSVYNVGIPSAMAGFLFDLDYVIIDKLMAGYGDIALAAVGIVLKAERLPLNVGGGICQGMMPLVAYNYTSGDHKRMKAVIRFSLLVGLAVGVISIALYELSAGLIMRAFIADAETVRLGTDFLRVRVLATPLMFASFYHVHMFQALGEGGRALFLAVFRWIAFNIPMLFILEHFFGMYGIVWAQLTADVFTVTLTAIVYHRYMKAHGLADKTQ